MHYTYSDKMRLDHKPLVQVTVEHGSGLTRIPTCVNVAIDKEGERIRRGKGIGKASCVPIENQCNNLLTMQIKLKMVLFHLLVWDYVDNNLAKAKQHLVLFKIDCLSI